MPPSSEVRLVGKCIDWVSECKINTENGVEYLIAIKSEGIFKAEHARPTITEPAI